VEALVGGRQPVDGFGELTENSRLPRQADREVTGSQSPQRIDQSLGV
jgi:hypothetical protein